MNLHNLFDASTRSQMTDLYGIRAPQIQRAAQNADEIDETFQDRADRFIVDYAKTHRKFLAEEVTAAAAIAGITSTAHGCWGRPFRRAQVRDVIKRIDYLPRANGNPAPLYVSMVFVEVSA
jgi:hypothetical protein